MASDFWAGYISGAVGIIIGNPLDVVKVRLQAGQNPAAAAAASSQQRLSRLESTGSLLRGRMVICRSKTLLKRNCILILC